LGLDFSNSIVIIDEAHHITRSAEDSLSFEFNIDLLTFAYQGLSNLAPTLFHGYNDKPYYSDLDIAGDVIKGLEEYILNTKDFLE
jgi:Rad3-related DNA helicase